jgi:hypothetical protein
MLLTLLTGGQSSDNAPVDLLDSLIYTTIVLFILSVITEKLTQLIRMYPSYFRIIGAIASLCAYVPIVGSGLSEQFNNWNYIAGVVLLFMFNTAILVLIVANSEHFQGWIGKERVKHLDMLNHVKKETKAATPTEQTTKEKEVTLLSFFVGVVVAYAFKANLFDLFETPPELGWKGIQPLVEGKLILNPEYFSLDLVSGIGLLLTAFFLAFGSKFFHDLLDTLLYTKNLKRHLNDKATYDIETTQELDTILKHTEGSLVRMAIEQNRETLEKLPNFLSVHEGPDLKTGRKIVYLNITDTNTKDAPRELKYELEGKTRTVAVYVITNAAMGKVSVGKIFNNNDRSYIGSIGLPITLGNELWILTCGHVMTGGSFVPDRLTGRLSNPEPATFAYKNGNESRGRWEYGYQDHEFDIALVKPDNADNVQSSGLASRPYPLSATSSSLAVSFSGAKTEANGIVFAQEVEEPLMFANTVVRMKGLVKISAPHGIGGISQPGDSGSVLVHNNNAVAMIIGSSPLFTYALSLEKILNGWEAQIR